MVLSYQDLAFFGGNSKRTQVNATISTNHSTSSYNQPVVVLDDGQAIDSLSWLFNNYHVEEATIEEKVTLRRMGLL